MEISPQDFATLVHSLFVIATPFQLSIHAWPSPFKIESQLNLVKATHVFVISQLLSLILPVAEKVGLGIDRVYVLGEGSGGQKTLEDLIQNFQHRELQILSPRPATKDTIAYFVCSSGTSGPPKGN
jgi:acyl-CoA synthetase (AMP-forming)/AMP-acid ligase II